MPSSPALPAESRRDTVALPWGMLAVIALGDSILATTWIDATAAVPNAGSTRDPLLLETRRQLMAFAARDLRQFDLPLAPRGTPFQQRVWSEIAAIPVGATRSYGDIASTLGTAPRAVGGACSRNPIPLIVPCHRVLGRGWSGGYTGGAGVDTKRALLAFEGVALGSIPAQPGTSGDLLTRVP